MVDVSDATFERDVLDRSVDVPVVVDLWAEWCGPCRTLGPVLEKAVAATGGRVALAKVDVDANPGVAASFAVQSIPAVFALKDRQVVDSFVGAQPERVVEEFVDRLAPSETEADRLAVAGDEVSLRKALKHDPGHAGAAVSLAELLVHSGDTEEALALLARVPETAETRRVAAMARIGSHAAAADGEEVDTRAARLLERVKDDDSARRELLDLLELLGPDDPRTPGLRKALAARLF